MALTPMGDFSFNHADQVDKPNITAAQAKTYFDSRASELKTALNNAIAKLNAVTDGASGADNIGMTVITETGASATVQSVIEALITRLKATTDSASGADLIGATAITQTGTAATTQAILEALAPMTTQGDITYQGASVPARLAKGTAGQVLEMNPGATAPQWGNTKLDEHKAETVSCSGILSRSSDVTTSLSVVTGFRPKWVQLQLAGDIGQYSNGQTAQTGTSCMCQHPGGLIGTRNNYIGRLSNDGASQVIQVSCTLTDTGFTLGFENYFYPTTTLNMTYLAGTH